ncbi:MAG: heavy metal translocating P-type ATPase [Defluviicoccus sp.]|nr:heavy metal translocating P-type ATPase [Defluviicoccus sp.]MDE0384032.1 heavy metal translocating P-type ATPase [Defluviicoccus sp.]
MTAELTLRVDGMTCGNCRARVERTLRGLDGVAGADVNLATERARIVYLPEILGPPAIADAIRGAGYVPGAVDAGAPPGEDVRAAAEEEIGVLRRRFFVAAAFTVPLFAIAMGSMLPGLGPTTPAGEQAWLWVQLVLAAPVVLWSGRGFFVHGWAELRHAAPGMNSLVAMGAGAAFAYSTLALLAPAFFPAGTAVPYFEAAGAIVTLILLGRLLEAVARGRASQAIAGLMELRPATARVLRGGEEREIPVEEVAIGDAVLIRPGERVPVDAAVVAGESFVDESTITGEPVPAAKRAGDEVFGGTVNGAGALTVRVVRIGADTVLGRVLATVAEAQSAKAPIARQADRIAGVLVPCALAVAALAFAAWLAFAPPPALSFAFVAAVSVLLIACPCAMGLATPTAILVGSGRGAERGVLIRNGAALETLARVRMIAFDKTGTLTTGRPVLTDRLLPDGSGALPDETLALIAAAERMSEHPLATALVDAVESDPPAVDSFSVEPGLGVAAEVAGREVLVGSARFLQGRGIDCAAAEAPRAGLEADGKTAVLAAIDGELAALLGFADPPREEAQGALSALAALGFDIAMITGDGRATAEAVARSLGIAEIEAEVLPDRKAESVRALRREGRRVAFVGDGINDAPALAEADTGIAIGSGTDIAIESADVVLMASDLRGVVTAIRLARRTLATIRVNLFWAYGYNVALIPVAAGALYPVWGVLLDPMLAAAAMSASSVLVVANSLRLRRFA